MTSLETVVHDDLDLHDPHELRHASHRWADDITAAAAAHGITVTHDRVAGCLNAAAEAGYVGSAAVQLPDRDQVVLVVEGADVVPKMHAYFAAVAADERALPTLAETEGAATPKGTGWKAKLLHRAATLPGVGTLADTWFARSPESLYEFARVGPLTSYQVDTEITQLLTLVKSKSPRSVLEIGTHSGGTTYLLARFSAPDADIVTCDLSPRVSAHTLQKRVRRRQHVEVLTIDSHRPESREQLFRRFPDGVDLLFIDGDHSYDGARADLVTYAPLARSGALIVLHDIVDDYRTRYGIATSAWVGGVPRLWREVRAEVPEGFTTHEFVNDRGQDGFGIGVLSCPSTDRPGAALVEHLAR